MADPAKCPRCGETWWGGDTGHCTVCHRTFTCVRAFDKHRLRDECVHPKERGLTLANRNYVCWGFPGEEGM